MGSAPKRAGDHDRVCRRSLQHFAATISFDGARRRRLQLGAGLAAAPHRLWLQLTSLKNGRVAFALFVGGWVVAFCFCFWFCFCFCFCQEKMEQKWKHVLLLLVFHQRKLGRTFKSGPSSPPLLGLAAVER